MLLYNVCFSFGPTRKDLEAIKLVWELTGKWEDAWDGYKTGNFWTIDVEEMEETANLLFRQFTRLYRELAEKKWEIIDNSR